jgi:hypothetical protein
MKTLVKWIKNLFKVPSYGDRLEAYIISRSPTNHADIEQLSYAFERDVRKGLV